MEKKIILFVYLFVTEAYHLGDIVENDNRIHYTEYAEEVGIIHGSIESKWCGPGNVSQIFEYAESKEAIDGCCTSHDTCMTDNYIKPNHEAHGLRNKMNYIASTCECNSHFVNCLKKTETPSALSAYGKYISEVPKCFKVSYPILRCIKYDIFHRCIKYDLKDGLLHYQWFDQYVSEGNDDGVLGDIFSSNERTVMEYRQFSFFEEPPQRSLQHPSPPFTLQEFGHLLTKQPPPPPFDQKSPPTFDQPPPLTWHTFDQPII